MGFSWWLTLAFIVLKLTGYIDWSWWWVVSPIIIVTVLFALINGLLSMLETNQDKKVKDILKRYR